MPRNNPWINPNIPEVVNKEINDNKIRKRKTSMIVRRNGPPTLAAGNEPDPSSIEEKALANPPSPAMTSAPNEKRTLRISTNIQSFLRIR